MTAAELVQLHGAALVGRIVNTVAMGEWPGGLAKVTEVAHDPGAPEISFLVRHEDPQVHIDIDVVDMGVFEYEEVELMP